MLSIYEYLNYRIFLKDLFREKKKTDTHFCHKVLLDKLGITSTGFLSNVIAGRKNLTHIQINKLSRLLKLSKPEARYFECLVYFTQGKTIEEKNEYFSRLVTLQKVKMKVLDKKKLSIFSKWYYVGIRELLNFVEFKGDAKKLAQLLEPAIKPSEAEEAIQCLEEMGLICKDENEEYKQAENAITTGDELHSLHLASFQLATMDLAKRALEKVPAPERDISNLTLTLSPDNFRLVKSEIQHFRKRIARIAVDDDSPDRVFQMNIQFFPLSIKQGGDDE